MNLTAAGVVLVLLPLFFYFRQKLAKTSRLKDFTLRKKDYEVV